MTRLPLVAALLVAGALTGCEAVQAGAPEARGPAEEIYYVLTDSVTWAGPVGDALRETLGQPIVTIPSNQGAFPAAPAPR